MSLNLTKLFTPLKISCLTIRNRFVRQAAFEGMHPRKFPVAPGSKYALVTGASSGIGWHISVNLAKKGYSIVAVSNQPEKLDNLKYKLQKEYGVSVITMNFDLSGEDAPEAIFDSVRELRISVEVLVNNAGVLLFGESVRTDYSATENIINLHVRSPALLCRLFAEEMTMRRAGYILNVSSISAVMPYPGISLYGPTKAFLRYYTRALRTEMKRYGVCVTCLIPGATATSLYDPGRFDNPIARKTGLIKNPESVASAGVKALFSNRAECVPGLINKLTLALLPLVPQFVISLIHRKTNLVR